MRRWYRKHMKLLIASIILATLLYFIISIKHYSSNKVTDYPDRFSILYNKKWLHGKTFSKETIEIAQKLVHFSSKHSDDTTMSDMQVLEQEPIYVTASSNGHASELRRKLLMHINSINLSRKIVVYDIGMR